MNYTHIPPISCSYAGTEKNALTAELLGAPEAHFEYELIFLTEGVMQVSVNQNNYRLSAPGLIFISRLERHSLTILKAPCHRYVVTIASDQLISSIQEIALISILTQRPKGFRHAIPLGEHVCAHILPLFEQMNEEYRLQDAYYSRQCTLLLSSALIYLYRSCPECFPQTGSKTMSQAVFNAQRCIHENFQQKLSLQEIADQNYISRHALSLAFKTSVGISFKEYLLSFRLAEAKKRLILTDQSVETIAQDVGYANVNNFIQIFKKYERVTPLRYRKQAAAGENIKNAL